MLSVLALKAGDQMIDFGENLADSRYFEQVSKYFDKLRADPCRQEGTQKSAMDREKEIPLCEGIVTDYCRMLLSELAGQMRELFEETCIMIEQTDMAQLLQEWQPDAGQFLSANAQLVMESAVIKQHMHVLDAEDTLEMLENLGKEPVWQKISQQNGILRQGLQLSGEFVYENRSGLTYRQAAALFYVRYAQADILYLRYADRLTECGITMDWECTQPYSRTIDIGAGLDGPYTVLAGDTLVRIAKMLAVLADDYQDAAWETFYQEFLSANGQKTEPSGAAGCYTVRFTTTVREDVSLASLFRRIYPDFNGDPQTRGLWREPLFQPLQEICPGAVDAGPGKTIEELVHLYGAGEVRTALCAGGLWAQGGQSVRIPHPQRIPIRIVQETILEKCRDTGSMLSRFLLQGLRVPSPETGETVPLYELLRQQIRISLTQDLTLALHVSRTFDASSYPRQWLTADDTPVTVTAEQIAGMLPCDMLPKRELPKALPVCEAHKSYTALTQIRILDQVYTAVSLPEAFRFQIAKERTAPPVLLVNGRPSDDFWWSAVFTVAVRRAGTSAFLVEGVPPEDRKRLSAISRADVTKIGIAFEPSKLASGKSQLASAADSCMLVKTNLSVQTHMGGAVFAKRRADRTQNTKERHTYSARLTDPAHFLEMLWQCSVIGGGFWMYCEGIPEDIFADGSTGRLYLYVLFADFAAAHLLADSVVRCGNETELEFFDAGETVYAPVSAPGTLSFASYPQQNGEISELFQIMSYTARIHTECMESAPVFPVKKDGRSVYLFTIPLYRLADPENCYSAVGKRFVIETGLRDILGNYAKLGDMEVTGVYNDEVLSLCEYPRTQACYEITDNGNGCRLHISAVYIPPAEPEAENNDLARADTARKQLACDGMYAFATCTAEGTEQRKIHRLTDAQFAQLKEYAQQLYEEILNGGGNLPAAEFIFELDETRVPAEIFPLSVSFGIVRGGCDSAFWAVRQAESVLPAKETMQTKKGFGNVLLASCAKGLYGAGLGTFFKKLRVEPFRYGNWKTPHFYVVAPYAKEPVTRKTMVHLYDGTVTERFFYRCDFNAWMKRFFEDTEYLLSAEQVCAAAAGFPDSIDRLAGAKQRLAEDAAARVIPLCGEFPENTAVAEAYRDYFAASLTNVYALDVAAVYKADFITAQECRAEITLKEDRQFLASKITGRQAQDEHKPGEFYLFSCNALHRNTKAQIPFFIRDLEYHIQRADDTGCGSPDLEDAASYDSSDWVRLHEPLELEQSVLAADFGIPHPVRLCPPSPSILRQEVLPGRLARWDYKITLSAPACEQYTIYLKLKLNQGRVLRAAGIKRDAFAVLADYDSQREEMFAKLQAGNYREVYEKAAALADELADVLGSWTDRPSFSSLAAEAEAVLSLQFTVSGALQLMAEDSNGALAKTGAKIGPVQILSGGRAGEVAEFSVTLQDFPVYYYQSVQPYVWMTQNENILETDLLHVRDEFLFCSQEVAAEPLCVTAVWQEPFETEAEDVNQAVHNIWQALGLLYPDTSVQADMEILYVYTLPGQPDGFEMQVPVLFVPQAEQEADVAERIGEWFSDKKFQVSDGRLCFDIRLRDKAEGRLAARLRVYVRMCRRMESWRYL